MQQSYGQDLAGLYGQYAGQQADVAGSMGSQLGSMYANAGSNMGNVAIGVAGNAQANANSLMGAYQNNAQYGGMVEQAQANASRDRMGTAASLLGGFLSDRRLKTDIEPVPSRFERIGLQGYRWRWNEKAGELGIAGATEGVIAQEVAQIHPEAVVVGPHGYMLVDYGRLERLITEAP
jgi:hypothetical protein